MKKKVILGLCLFVAFILLFPFSVSDLDDGGSVVYEAALYRVDNVHSMCYNAEGEPDFAEGTVVTILGLKVFDNVDWSK